MIDHDQMLLDRLATLEARALEGLAPNVPEGARLYEVERRVGQAVGWLTLARRGCDPADAAALRRATAHLLAAAAEIETALT